MKTLNPQEQTLFAQKPPKRTSSYTPISHVSLIESIHEELDKRKMKIVQKNYNIGHGGDAVIAHYGIKHEDADMGMMLAFRNSYDKSLSAAFASGAQVYICENGMIRADMKIIRKHTGIADYEIKYKLKLAIESMEAEFNKLVKQKEDMKQQPLPSRKVIAELLGRLYIDEQIITSTQLNVIKGELEKPTHKYTAGKESLWDFYNYLTFGLKQDNPYDYITRHSDIHEFVASEFSIK